MLLEPVVGWLRIALVKSKFQYADFPGTSATNPSRVPFQGRGSFEEVDVVEFGLYSTDVRSTAVFRLTPFVCSASPAADLFAAAARPHFLTIISAVAAEHIHVSGYSKLAAPLVWHVHR